ncbi:unnamed protein product [Diabrotica balteata]|uniref:Uncharacterized protein n=1 Tax=Diabrotica balteata TaxID=107213 RepID=A0A9N9XEL2_DIABA|nr:unnamed protein product [Diabrotica balteata]
MPSEKLEKVVMKPFKMDPAQNNSQQELVTEENENPRGMRNVTFREWVVVGILCFVNLINYMDRFTIAELPILFIMAKKFDTYEKQQHNLQRIHEDEYFHMSDEDVDDPFEGDNSEDDYIPSMSSSDSEQEEPATKKMETKKCRTIYKYCRSSDK